MAEGNAKFKPESSEAKDTQALMGATGAKEADARHRPLV